MFYEIPGQPPLELRTVILDLNGTLAVHGKVPDGVKERLDTLRQLGLRIVLLTGNTHNNADEIAAEFGVECIVATDGRQKAEAARHLDASTCASIGNGLIDLALMKVVRLRIVTLQSEGVHVQTLLASDIVVPSIHDALDLLIKPGALAATLRV